MQKKEIIEGLVKIGLSEKEARVYLAALELGEATAQQIAAKATVNRPSTYIAIEELTQRGMMSSFQKGKKRYFLAGKPTEILDLLEREEDRIAEKKKKAKDLIKKLSQVGTKEEDTVKAEVFVGLEGLGTMQRRLIDTAKLTKKIDTIVAVNTAREFIPKKAMEPLWRELDRNKIVIRSLYTGDTKQRHTSKYWQSRNISKRVIPFSGEISVSGEEIYLLDSKLSGVIITNPAIADTVRALFDCAWLQK